MKPVGQVRDASETVLWLHAGHDVNSGDLLAASWMHTERYGEPDAPLRTGRVRVVAVRKDGGLQLDRPAAAIVALCKGEYGDWLYRVEDDR